MASVLSHPAVPLGLALGMGSKRITPALLAAGVAGSVLPDVDAIGFWLGVPYRGILGHRGLTHSLLFALLVGAAGALCAAGSTHPSRAASVLAFLFVCTASHGVLDALTNGGLGVAFFSPFSNHRYFLPWRVLEVSPIGIGGLGLGRAMTILGSELRWIWLPCLGAGTLTMASRRLAGRSRRPSVGTGSRPRRRSG
jgi:inner membrane protein